MPFLEKLGVAVGGQIAGSVLGQSNAAAGGAMDLSNKLSHEKTLYSRAQERGLTPQEYYGSSAPGGATGTSGSGQVIGNQANAMASELNKAYTQTEENEKDRQNAKEIAGIQAGVQTAGQQNQAQIAANSLALQKRQFNEIALKESAAKLKINEQELKKKVNEVTTSEPKWHLMLKNLSMGPGNMWVQSYIEHTGVNPITDPEAFRKLPKEERKKFLLGFLAYESRTLKETAGIADLLGLTEQSEWDGPPTLGAGNTEKPPKEWKEKYSNPFFTIKKRE